MAGTIEAVTGDPAGEEPTGSGQGVMGPGPGDGQPGDGEAWAALVDRTRSILRGIAGEGRTITYDELRARLGIDLPHRGAGDLATLLRAASLAENREGRGLVSTVVVGPSGRPGRGWFRLAAEAGRDVADPEQAWQAERSRLSGEKRL